MSRATPQYQLRAPSTTYEFEAFAPSVLAAMKAQVKEEMEDGETKRKRFGRDKEDDLRKVGRAGRSTSIEKMRKKDKVAANRGMKADGLERDKSGHIIRTCGIQGCKYRTGITTHMKNHKAAKHKVGEKYMWKPPADGKDRDRWGRLMKCCGIGGCNYKTSHSQSMKNHQLRKHLDDSGDPIL